MIDVPDNVRAAVAEHPYPLVFATISGAHLYGFASDDSDYDVRGVHVLPLEEVAGLRRRNETIERMAPGPPELDVVTHDAEKFFRLLLKPNGYVLEQLCSPLVLATTPEHDELREIARDCVTRQHVRHYAGFAENQWRLFEKDEPPRVKPLLYVFRVLLTGIHLLRTGQVEANLVRLNETARLSFIDDLIARKKNGSERQRLTGTDVALYRAEYERLFAALLNAGEMSSLPERPSAFGALNDLLLRLRHVL
jgi:predicted nucleotidyltransferase